MNIMNGRLVKHSYRPEWGAGIIKGRRTKEKFDRETVEGGVFVLQYKVWFTVGGEGWFDRNVLTLLPMNDPTPTPGRLPANS